LACAGRATGAGACQSTPECLREVQAAQQGTDTVSARFVQTKSLSLLAQPLVSRGRFLFKRPDHVVWQVEEPQAATVVIDGQGIHIPGLSARDRQALAMVPARALTSQLGAIFSGTTAGLEGEFDVTARDDGGAVLVHLVPRRPETGQLFRTIDLRFPRPLRFVQTITLEDAVGDRVEVGFEDVRVNVEVPDSAFTVDGEAARP